MTSASMYSIFFLFFFLSGKDSAFPRPEHLLLSGQDSHFGFLGLQTNAPNSIRA